jgi:squalene-associated FAD-dependent desaturase
MGKPVVHIIGAGLAGLAAAVRLADASCDIALYESARQAGGRCRSYFDASLGMAIDNGNHLLLSGNRAALAFLQTIGAQDKVSVGRSADFAFVDLASNRHWRVRPNAGPFPWWIFIGARRVPDTNWRDYLSLLRLLLPGADRPIGAVMACEGALYERLWRPFLLAALNTEPSEGSSHLAAAIVRETLAKGSGACRPIVAHGLSAAFIDPAIAYLKDRGAAMRLDHRLRKLEFSNGRVAALDFGDARVALGDRDAMILAVPAPVAQDLLPNLAAPRVFRSIVNAHFKIAPPKDLPAILGVVNGTIEWLFAFPDRLSVTISGADRLLDVPREELAATIWAETAQAARLEKPLPPWQIIKEKRATFAATPDQNALRPDAGAGGGNLALAGDWTATGLPATIEGAIRSGDRAAALIRRRLI